MVVQKRTNTSRLRVGTPSAQYQLHHHLRYSFPWGISFPTCKANMCVSVLLFVLNYEGCLRTLSVSERKLLKLQGGDIQMVRENSPPQLVAACLGSGNQTALRWVGCRGQERWEAGHLGFSLEKEQDGSVDSIVACRTFWAVFPSENIGALLSQGSNMVAF